MDKKLPGLIAHRGYSLNHPANTFEAFKAALQYRPIGIEMDVVFFDGHITLYHPHGHQQVYGREVDQVIDQELSANESAQSFITKAELHTLLKYVAFVIFDLKQENNTHLPQLMQLIDSYQLERHQVVIGIRDVEKLKLMQGYKDLCTILSLSSDPDSFHFFIQHGANIIRLWHQDTTSERIQAIHELGKQVWITPGRPTSPGNPGTAGEVTRDELIQLAELEIDAVLVNDIEMARAILSSFYEKEI